MPVKAVIFDLDGTITQPYFDFDAIRAEMGLTNDAGPVLEAIKKMTPDRRREAERILDYHEQRAVEQSKLNAGSRETLDKLRQMGLHIGLLTRNRRSNAEAVSHKHGLYFDAIVDRDDGPVKPDAFGVLCLCRRFGIEPHEALVVGDYLFDLLCARAAGAQAVLLVNTEKAKEFVEHADFTIYKLDQVLDIVQQTNGCGV
jgi:HAD superfamily hydrolase (TIGR01509 family)